MVGPRDLEARLSAGVTGRQLAVDGTFALTLLSTDPATQIISPSDGTAVLWLNSGVLTLAAFTRSTGWRYSVMA